MSTAFSATKELFHFLLVAEVEAADQFPIDTRFVS